MKHDNDNNTAEEALEFKQRTTREALHAMVDDLGHRIYLIDGNGVFDEGPTIMMMYEHVYALHDLVDGNPVGTLQAKQDELVSRATVASHDDDFLPF